MATPSYTKLFVVRHHTVVVVVLQQIMSGDGKVAEKLELSRGASAFALDVIIARYPTEAPHNAAIYNESS